MKLVDNLLLIDNSVINKNYNIQKLKTTKTLNFSALLKDCCLGDTVYSRFYKNGELLRENVFQIVSNKYVINDKFSIKKNTSKKSYEDGLDTILINNDNYFYEISDNSGNILYLNKIKFKKSFLSKFFKFLLTLLMLILVLLLLHPDYGVNYLKNKNKTLPEFRTNFTLENNTSTINLNLVNYYKKSIKIQIYKDNIDDSKVAFTSSIIKNKGTLENIYLNGLLDEGKNNLIIVISEILENGELKEIMKEDIVVNVKE